MTHSRALPSSDIQRLASFDSCTVSDAIERLHVRLRNEGFVSGGIRSQTQARSPMVGYAATGRVRTAEPPMAQRCYHERMDWWSYVASLPEPRVLVLQDMEPAPGSAAFVDATHVSIGRALKCVGCLTNGAVRSLPAAEARDFQLFSSGVAVSHSYAHIVEFGGSVEIGGLKIQSADLLHGDRHGVLTIPLDAALRIPDVAIEIQEEERELARFCASPRFSLEGLAERLRASNSNFDAPGSRH